MSVDSSRSLVGAVSYILGFVTGVVILMVEKDDKFIRFHAMQSTIATGSLFVLNIILGVVLSPLGIFAFVSTLSGFVIWALIIASCFAGFVQAKRGRVYKLPIFGHFSEGFVK